MVYYSRKLIPGSNLILSYLIFRKLLVNFPQPVERNSARASYIWEAETLEVRMTLQRDLDFNIS
jgi:hypothetical protein